VKSHRYDHRIRHKTPVVPLGLFPWTQAMLIRCLSRYVVCAIPLLVVGCASTAPDLSNYCVRQVSATQPQQLLNLAEDVLQTHNFAIYERDDMIGRLRARVIVDAGSPPPRNRRIHRLTGDARRHADVWVKTNAQQLAIYCKVLLQQRVTEAHRMLQRDYTGNDTPNDTPIDRDAATTEEQNTLWRTLRRDRRSERELLDAIEQAIRP